MGPFSLEWIEATDPRMAEVHAVRHEALFAPFGIPRDDRWDDQGADRCHLAALVDGRVVGYACLVLDPDGSGHVRQVSVLERARGQGIGRELMAEVEREARRRGLSLVWLNARCTAEGFYHGLGWRTVSGVFPAGRTGVPHVRMEWPPG
ncbi:MAG: GNAT family N-acetyltransferase [Coriobacteriia bacterium]|nr:GNAT family N-acetyltransferase [Coriobacteriia bacterium]MBN2847031.1 GNAT family N-acetyltransferase [Coriobacteriia bacterium]